MIVNFTVASSSRNAPTVVVKAPVGQLGTLGPKILTFSEIPLSNGYKAGYNLWSGLVDVGTNVTGAVTITVVTSQGDDLDILFI